MNSHTTAADTTRNMAVGPGLRVVKPSSHRDASRTAYARTSPSSAKEISARSRPLPASTQTSPGAVTSTSLTPGRRNSASNTPAPTVSSRIVRRISSTFTSETTPEVSARMMSATSLCDATPGRSASAVRTAANSLTSSIATTADKGKHCFQSPRQLADGSSEPAHIYLVSYLLAVLNLTNNGQVESVFHLFDTDIAVLLVPNCKIWGEPRLCTDARQVPSGCDSSNGGGQNYDGVICKRAESGDVLHLLRAVHNHRNSGMNKATNGAGMCRTSSGLSVLPGLSALSNLLFAEAWL